MVFNAVFEEAPEADDGGYVAYAEDLSGAISEGTRWRRRAKICETP